MEALESEHDSEADTQEYAVSDQGPEDIGAGDFGRGSAIEFDDRNEEEPQIDTPDVFIYGRARGAFRGVLFRAGGKASVGCCRLLASGILSIFIRDGRGVDGFTVDSLVD